MEEKRKMKRIRDRILLTFSLTFWIFFVLAFRLFQVQIIQAHRFSKMATVEHTEKIAIPAVRGKIFDRNGELWAMSTTGHSVAAFPPKIKDKVEVAEMLSRILGLKEQDVLKSLQSSYAFVWISRKVDLDKLNALKQANIRGIEIVEEPTGKRFYPKGELACHVLGFSGIDDQGLNGVELYYDKELHGKPGYFWAETDGLGRVLPEGVFKVVPAVPGGDITLTLDETIQYTAEKELKQCVRERHAKGGSVIVMNPDNGEILALANYPSYDGSRYGQYPSQALRNGAISDDYEPGSTFKSILAAAALETGKIAVNDQFLSGPSITLNGWEIRNAEDGIVLSSPFQNLEAIMVNSLNVGAASVAEKIGVDAFSSMIDRLGLYKKTGIDLPGEVGSLIPESKQWTNIQLATISFGQGIAVTPVQLATAYSILANGGHLVHPHVMKSISFDGGHYEYHQNLQEFVLSSQTAAEVKSMLQAVVNRGTGVQAAVPNYDTAGKTGTAQVSRNGVYASGAYVASFVGFVPVEKPAMVILVKIDEPRFPYWGGTVSAPVFKNIAEESLWHLQVPPTHGITTVGANN